MLSLTTVLLPPGEEAGPTLAAEEAGPTLGAVVVDGATTFPPPTAEDRFLGFRFRFRFRFLFPEAAGTAAEGVFSFCTGLAVVKALQGSSSSSSSEDDEDALEEEESL